jgi:lysine decarboxylase
MTIGIEEAPYVDALERYAASNPARYNVPTHKGGPQAPPRLIQAIGERAVEMDIPPLIVGIDADAETSPYAVAQRLAAEAWGAKRTWFLVNGASQANLAACLTFAHRGREVIVQRNVHTSVIDGLVLSGLRPVFVAAEIDERLGIAHCVTPAALHDACESAPDAAGLIVVSPSYYGTTAELQELVVVAHEHDIPIHVDEAWGAHFRFHEALPQDALSAGADLVVSSTHKMLGSLTQSAMIHLGHTDRIDERQLDQAVVTLESTSRNALLALSLDAARQRAVADGHELIDASLPAVAAVRRRISEISGVEVLDDRVTSTPGVNGYDPFRLCIDVSRTGLSGVEVGRRLREDHDVHVELSGPTVLVAILAMGERSEDGARLVAGVEVATAASAGATGGDDDRTVHSSSPPWGRMAMTPREAFFSPSHPVDLASAVDRVSVEALAVYPPGIPNVLPGEILTTEMIDYLVTARERGAFIRGASDSTLATLRVTERP